MAKIKADTPKLLLDIFKNYTPSEFGIINFMVEYGEQDPKVRDLTFRQKLQFIRNKLDQVPEHDSYEQRGGIWVKLIHPQVIPWITTAYPHIFTLPPREGKIVNLIVDRHFPSYQRGKKPVAAVLDFTRTSNENGVEFAVVGLGGLEITQESEIVIDCRKLGESKRYVQYALTNFFVDKELAEVEPTTEAVA